MGDQERDKVITVEHEGSWHDGSCCCNCMNRIALSKHPWNPGEARGMITEHFGYACILEHEIASDRRGAFFTEAHGFCELHNPLPELLRIRENREKSEKIGI